MPVGRPAARAFGAAGYRTIADLDGSRSTRGFRSPTLQGMTLLGPSIRPIATWVIVLGGLLMAALWLVYTVLHGPTSFQQDRVFLGQGVHFWGMLLGVVPNSLIAAGLIACRGELTPSRRAAIGHALTCGALIVPAVLDLAVQAINAPFFLPLQSVGVLTLAAGLGPRPAYSTLKPILRVLGGLLGAGMVVAFIPADFSDSIGGFRLFGVLAYFLAGLAWSTLGYQLSQHYRSRVP